MQASNWLVELWPNSEVVASMCFLCDWTYGIWVTAVVCKLVEPLLLWPNSEGWEAVAISMYVNVW